MKYSSTIRWTLLAALLCGALLASPAMAKGKSIESQIKRFNKHPDARLAWKLHEHFRSKGQLGKAMNWAERALASPRLTSSIQRQATNLRHSLRWDLRDAGYGLYKINVTPAHAWLTIDRKKIHPRRNQYLLWLPEGSHAMDLKAKDYADESRIIAASRGEVREMRVAMEMIRAPEIRVEIQPANAEIWANRVFLGHATRRVFRVAPGPKVIEIRAPGYIRWVKTIPLKAGARHVIKQKLQREVKDGLKLRMASNVERKLTPLEMANRGGRGSRLGNVRNSGPARGGPPAAARGGGAGGEYAPPPGVELPTVEMPKVNHDDEDAPPAPGGGSYDDVEEDEDEFSDAAPADVVVDSGGGSSGGSSVFKGLIWSGIGLALVGGGTGLALVSVTNARLANGMALGHSQYDDYYDPAAQMAWVGYGTAALGGVSLAVGSMYLFGAKGLSRSGKGWTLATLGLLSGGVGGYLVLDAVAEAEAANSLKDDDKNYTPNFDGAEQTWWTGVATASVGGLLALTGLYVALTGSSRSADLGTDESIWSRVAIAPSLAPGHVGGVLHLRW